MLSIPIFNSDKILVADPLFDHLELRVGNYEIVRLNRLQCNAIGEKLWSVGDAALQTPVVAVVEGSGHPAGDHYVITAYRITSFTTLFHVLNITHPSHYWCELEQRAALRLFDYLRYIALWGGVYPNG